MTAAIRSDVPPDPSPEDAPFPRPNRSVATVTPRDVRVFCPETKQPYTIRVTTRTFTCPGWGKVGHASNT